MDGWMDAQTIASLRVMSVSQQSQHSSCEADEVSGVIRDNGFNTTTQIAETILHCSQQLGD